MTMPPTESSPAPLSPDQFHDVDSLKSPLNPNPTIQSDDNTSTNPRHENDVIPSWWARPMSSLIRRNKRPAKYPTPFDKYFQQLEFLKVIAISWAIAGCVATFVDLNLISIEFMRLLLDLLAVATSSFMIAHTLQDMVPELAMAAMITGIALVIALFHAVVFKLLHLPQELFRLAVSLLSVAYILLLVVTLYKVFKEDVREKEDVEENASGDDSV